VIHVTCQNCHAFDIAGPGHPAVTYDAEAQQHVLTDRTALRHAHADDCEPDAETGHYPLHFTFFGAIGGAA
jgi:hypothetical protein